MYTTLIAQKRNLLVQAPATAITITLMIVLPFLVHLIPPIGQIPVGAFLLPIFYAPLAAIFLCHPLVSILAGLVVPYINYLLTGQPVLPVAASLSVEVSLFSITLLYFNRIKISGSGIVLAAFVFAKLGSAVVGLMIGGFSLMGWFSGLAYALPGLLVLVLMYNWLRHRVVNN